MKFFAGFEQDYISMFLSVFFPVIAHRGSRRISSVVFQLLLLGCQRDLQKFSLGFQPKNLLLALGISFIFVYRNISLCFS